MTTASEQILSHNVAHQIALSRYSTGVTKKNSGYSRAY